MSQTNEQKQIIKVILLGETNVGKTQIMNYYVNQESKPTQPTIYVSFVAKDIELNGQKYTFQIWDTAGQERFRSIAKSYIRGAQGCLVVYSLVDQHSFDAIPTWISSISGNSDEDKIPIVLIGNKCDLQETVPKEQGEDLAAVYNIPFLRTSAIDGVNINEAFDTLARLVVNSPNFGKSQIGESVIILSEDPNQQKKEPCKF